MNKVLGILGGGQLARMLAESALKLQVDFKIYTQSSVDPVCTLPSLTSKISFGSMLDHELLAKFCTACDVILFESEFIEDDTVEFLEKNATHVQFVPALSVIKKLKNKGEQKKLFEKIGIPQPQFLFFSGSAERKNLQKFLDRCHSILGQEYVLKWTEGGYDGKGVLFFKKEKNEEAIYFIQKALESGKNVYAEEKIKIDKECAAICIRDFKGDYFFYPLVLSVQEEGVCREVLGPAIEFGVHSDFEKKALEYMKKIAQECDLRGVLAAEFFLTQDQRLLVNELAPRVHNTGHYTQSVYEGSQFENHVNAALQKPLQTLHKPGFFYMRNLLGPKGSAGEILNSNLGKIPPDPHWFFYWYGKKECKSLRKMGHVNYWSQKKEDIFENQNKIKEWEKKLWQKIL